VEFLAELHRTEQIPVLCKYISTAKAHALEAVRSTNWSAVSGFVLVQTWADHAGVHKGSAVFLPKYPVLHATYAAQLYVAKLAHLDAERARAGNEVGFVEGAWHAISAGPHAKTEIKRRAARHPYGHITTLIASLLELLPDQKAEEILRIHLDRLSSVTRWKLAAAFKEQADVGSTLQSQEGRLPRGRVVWSDVWQTIAQRLKRPLFEEIARALDGEWDIMPRAVADDAARELGNLIRDRRTEAAALEAELTVPPSEEERSVDRESIKDEIPLPYASWLRDEREREAVRLEMEGKKGPEIASELGLTPAAYRQLRKRIRDRLKHARPTPRK